MRERDFCLETWGHLACFTRPELKVERMSYPVMTPSAARGVLDAIYSKPVEFGWRVDRIEVMNPIRYLPLRRNEVKEKVSVSVLQSAMHNGGAVATIIADATKEMVGNDQQGRTQRQTMALVDVRYRIHAHIQPRPAFAAHLTALIEQARRRMEGGKCFYQPYLGCREFPAFFQLVDADDGAKPEPINLDLGHMLYDVFDLNEARTDGFAPPRISLFRAQVVDGVLEVPAYESDSVLKAI